MKGKSTGFFILGIINRKVVMTDGAIAAPKLTGAAPLNIQGVEKISLPSPFVYNTLHN